MWKPIILDVECIVCNKSLQKINHDPLDATRKMGKIACRRSRTPNWSIEEKKYLLELIKERKDVVIVKNNNGPHYSEDKDVAWNEILRELAVKFGSKFSGSSTKKVKTQWQNMKRIAREEIALVGPDIGKFTKQTLEVCYMLDMIKDGVLKRDDDNMNDTIVTNVEIKTERLDESSETNEPSCSGVTVTSKTITMPVPAPQVSPNPQLPSTGPQSIASLAPQTRPQPPSSDSSVSDAIEFEAEEPVARSSVAAMTMTEEAMDTDGLLNPFHRQLQEFFKYTSDEKQLKMESLKEERRVVRAMRETAELHKIIAEQRLKHLLWLKRHEMAMYSGEPGSGAGKGGGAGGSIREAGGTFGKMEAAREDEYFYKKQKEQLANLKGHLGKEIAFHQEQIKRHEDAIRRHKETMADMDNKH